MLKQQRLLPLLLAVLLVLTLTACQEEPAGEPTVDSPDPQSQLASEQEEPEASAILYADLSGGASNGEELVLIRTTEIPLAVEATAEGLADALSQWIGLDFTLNSATISEDSVTVDWSVDSTLIAGLDDREQKDEFHFFDAVSLNWCMMDSLARTLTENLPVTTVYYTMDVGKPLSVFSMEDMETQGFYELPPDMPYEGSPFFLAHSDVVGDFSYYDEENQLMLCYPSNFASEGEQDDDGFVTFSSDKEGTTLHYWVGSNEYEEDGPTLLDRMPLEEGQILESGAAVGFGQDMDQLTGEFQPFASCWLVEADRVAVANVRCDTLEEAETWYHALLEEAITILVVEEAAEGESAAMEHLSAILEERMTEGTALVSTGEDEVAGERCYTFAFGANTPEKFTAEEHFAVTEGGAVYVLDISTNEYVPYGVG